MEQVTTMTPVDGDSADGCSFTHSSDDPAELTLAIVKAVSWVTGQDSERLGVLADSIDVASLFRIIDSQQDFYRSSSQAESLDPSVTFQYEGCIITVTPTEITVRED